MQELANLILKEWEDHIEITEEQAIAIANFIISEYKEEYREYFIEADLNIFRTKKEAFNWFFDYDKTGRVHIDNVDVDITEDMVGRNLKDIMLEEQENYQEVAGLHLVWWL